MSQTTDFAPSRGFVQPYESIFDSVRRATAVAGDGTRITYEQVGSEDPSAPVIVLANGLGGRLYSWLSLIDGLGKGYRYITWDYRGLFDSEAPADPKSMSIALHAADLQAILDAEKVERAHLFGWSMGVQVSLELALRQPARVSSLVLINGTCGKAFSTAFQPWREIPRGRVVVQRVIELGLDHPKALERLGAVLQRGTAGLFWVRKTVFGFKQSSIALGLRQYISDVFRSRPDNYLKLFLQLDAHTVDHLLGDIQVPTTVISGALDLLTPARQSHVMARDIPDAVHVSIAMGSHFVMVERPRRVLPAIMQHMERARSA